MREIPVCTLVGDDQVIHAVYDVEMGLPTGPLRTAHTCSFIDAPSRQAT